MGAANCHGSSCCRQGNTELEEAFRAAPDAMDHVSVHGASSSRSAPSGDRGGAASKIHEPDPAWHPAEPSGRSLVEASALSTSTADALGATPSSRLATGLAEVEALSGAKRLAFNPSVEVGADGHNDSDEGQNSVGFACVDLATVQVPIRDRSAGRSSVASTASMSSFVFTEEYGAPGPGRASQASISTCVESAVLRKDCDIHSRDRAGGKPYGAGTKARLGQLAYIPGFRHVTTYHELGRRDS